MSNETLNYCEVDGEKICELVREMAEDDMEISFDDATKRLEIRWEVMGEEGDDVERVERRESDKYYVKLTRRLPHDQYEKHGALFSARKVAGENKYVVAKSFFVEGKGTESVGTVQDAECGAIVGAKEKEQEKYAIYKMLKAMLAMGFEGDYSYDYHRMHWEMEKPLVDLHEEDALVIMERAFSLLKKLEKAHWGKMLVGYVNDEGRQAIRLVVSHFAAVDFDWAPIIDLVDKTNRTAEEVEEVMCRSRYGRAEGVRPLRTYSTFGRGHC